MKSAAASTLWSDALTEIEACQNIGLAAAMQPVLVFIEPREKSAGQTLLAKLASSN